MRETQEPVVTKETGPMDGDLYTHPCFGQISAARRSGSTALYDSEFVHQNTIAITIKTSQLRRSLSNNWHFARNELIEVELSEAQWATFVSSLNIGSGIPCTLRHFNGQSIPALPEPITDREKFKLEFDQDMKDAFDRLKSLETMIEDSKLSGKAKEEIAKKIASVRSCFTSSMPFVAAQFGEHMENTVEKAKIEVNAYATQTLASLGMKGLESGLIQFKEEK